MALTDVSHTSAVGDNATSARLIYSKDLCRSCERSEALDHGVLCSECDSKRALITDAVSGRFPRTNVTSQAMAFAELLRVAAAELGSLADYAHTYEAGTLRRRMHGVSGPLSQLSRGVSQHDRATDR